MQLTQTQIDTLRRSPLFYNMEPEAILPRLNGTLSELPQGGYLFMDGDLVDRVYILLEGTLHAGRMEDRGQEFLLQQLQPSYLAGGEIVCTPRKTAPYHIYAATDCLLWSCSWDSLHRVDLELQLQLFQNLLSLIANQNIRKYYKIEALSLRSVRDRTLKYLEGQAFRSGSRSFTISMDRQALADYLCVNRSVLSHELKKLEDEGILRFRKNQFTLLK